MIVHNRAVDVVRLGAEIKLAELAWKRWVMKDELGFTQHPLDEKRDTS
jgi:hypothetical protein